MMSRVGKVESFGSEMLQAFQAGASGRVVIQLNNEAKVHKLVMRFNMLRQAMRQEEHYMLSIAEGVEVKKKLSLRQVWLEPKDNEFGTAIAEALEEGKGRKDISAPPLPPLTRHENINTTSDAMEAFTGKKKGEQ